MNTVIAISLSRAYQLIPIHVFQFSGCPNQTQFSIPTILYQDIQGLTITQSYKQ